MNRPWLALMVVLISVSAAHADVGPSMPAAKYPKETIHRIEIAETQPEFVFVVSHSDRGRKVEERFVELKPDQPLELTGRYRDEITLFIVSRSVAQRYATASALIAAIQNGVIPATRSDFYSREPVPEWHSPQVTINYRVQPAAGGLEVVRTSWDPLWQLWAVAILGALAFLLGGLWLIRRVRRGSPERRNPRAVDSRRTDETTTQSPSPENP